ncbi:uncharacterized protein LOC132259549 [Phlebotomus argentipes]|uniref:uncharacterized protein LOC132259549 n=1 Tax=Phlebotomus argentipes TaxID=94469 RepID=UPI002893618A|nr:uncharacterized protein LOC132259549 [Phlebotomus argentipes]
MSAAIYRESPHGTPSHFPQGQPPFFSSPASLQHFHQPHPHLAYGQRHCKRKSAVELLAESKPLYVKSETVLDRDQQLFRGVPMRKTRHSGCESPQHSASAFSADMLSPSRTLSQQASRHAVQPTRASRRSASALAINSDLLQTKLRKLLNSESKEMLDFGYPLSSSIAQELNVHQPKDSSVFFSSAFLSPQSLPPQPVSDDDDVYRFDETLILTDDYHAISPPAEYAERAGATPRYYQRSFSHSQAASGDYSPSFNINSHKSLPDLNLQVSRHSPHSEALSCCSRGNRSNKSGSSFNRDSGGSSGHYTHQSEPAPCCSQPDAVQGEFRRDSGSSTQHSGNSYFAYGIPPLGFDDKADDEADCLLDFTTAEVPEAFQDDYQVPSARQAVLFFEEKAYGRQEGQEELSPPGLGVFKRQKCLRLKQRGRGDDRRPILRSKSDISDRYWGREGDKRHRPEMFQLERFFDRLGLNEKSYEELVTTKGAAAAAAYSDKDSDQSSVVFFSDVSTVDSTRLPDSTAEAGQASGPYRSTEPPSIVERNARIIKWLCNCRRVQLT